MSIPETRWAAAGDRSSHYGGRFAALVSSGQDIDGEARLADVLLPRHGRVLDAGAGMGRVAAALGTRGHDVVAIDPDPALVAQARATYPGLSIEQRDILSLGAADGPFDLVVCVGNVMVYLAEGTDRQALAAMGSVLGPQGRILVGFHLQDPPPHARHYTAAAFEADAEAAGLRVEQRFGSYDLRAPGEEYGVWILGPASEG